MNKIKWAKGANRWYKLWSVWAMVILTVYPWLVDNQALLGDYISEKYRPFIGLALGLLGIIARLLRQENLADPQPISEFSHKDTL